MTGDQAANLSDARPARPATVLDATLLVDCVNIHAQGVQWHPRQRRLFWTDFESRRLWSCDDQGDRLGHVMLEERLATFAFCDDGRMLGAFADGLGWLDPRSGARRLFEPYMQGENGVRMHNGAVDRQGRFIVGGMATRPDAPGTPVWSVDRGRVQVLFDGVRVANSIAFSADGRTMYFADAPTGDIQAADYNSATGSTGTWRALARIAPEDGAPDGACVDAEGGLWTALRGGGVVARHLPDGTCDIHVRVPVPDVTGCAIGGPSLRRMFITTAATGASAAHAAAGGIFAVDLPVRGLATLTYTR